jgi:hypothetical protein
MTRLYLSLLFLFQVPAVLQQATGSVAGVVRTTIGAPIEGARVAVTPARKKVVGEVLESMARTDKDGRFVLEGIAPGRYYLVIGSTLTQTYYPGVGDKTKATVIEVTARNTITVPDMVLSSGTRLTGRIVDASTGAGRSVQSLSLCCEYYSYSGNFAGPLNLVESGRNYTAAVNPDGSFEFADLPTGNYTLRAFAPDLISAGQPIAVRGTEMVVDVKVSAGVAVSGRVVDRAGGSARGVYVRLRPLLSSSSFSVPIPVPRTSAREVPIAARYAASLDEIRSNLATALNPEPTRVADDGSFSFKRVLPGRYALEVSGSGSSTEREIEVLPQDLEDVRVEIPQIQLRGRVVTSNNEPLPRLDGSIRVIPSAPGAQIVYTFPDDQGLFALTLPAGEYRISTENLKFGVRSITAGTKNILTEPFTYDGVSRPEIVITLVSTQ